ncbi:glutaredoxin [Spirochaeta thermophila DSM 6578]|uniref:Glutaredoxin n=1 Tax=Winmispira thermophila (strain ATCC 700085 / DSM 6578 / Z-1203) TaxID=869211 RepID=G0GA41_WINT7|nr:thioredoxin family protein [Spirochaeta thermophila]AEJ61729.1 glutaredoxin [Spirochaeta thermophila DSM 6578]
MDVSTRLAEIDREIESLKARLAEVKGRETEIYTRIVGYYRSLKNWNKGKKEEYRHRKTFEVGLSFDTFRTRERREADEILYFYRKACPYCPAMRQALEEAGISYRAVDVDTAEGQSLAERYGVLGTPTVLLLDGKGKEVGRTTSPEELKDLLKGAAAVA